MSDRTPEDEPITYEPTAELRPDEGAVVPVGETEELGTVGAASPRASHTSKPIVISSTPQPSSLTEARRLTAKQRIEERREGSLREEEGIPQWVWLAAGAFVLFLMIILLASRGGDDGAPAGDGRGSGAAGSLQAGDTDLFALAGGKSGGKEGSPDVEALRDLEGEIVSAYRVEVRSVVSDRGFWVGRNASERFFVALEVEGESGPKIQAGDTIDFVGELRPVPLDFRDRFDLGSSGGAERLKKQGVYVSVSEAPSAD